MSAYHQMGHDSENIVLSPDLSAFAGAILSPVNYSFERVLVQCERIRKERPRMEIIFDPQLYIPASARGDLGTWPHKPADLDTADLSSLAWWTGVVDKVVDAAAAFVPDAICSPAPLPGAYDDGYYQLLVQIANDLDDKVGQRNTDAVLTALVGLPDLARGNRYLAIASILSGFRGTRIYLVFDDDTRPRLERTDSGRLEAGCRLIRLLANAGFEVLVGFTSSELVIWKAAGARHVASGKFFNLRRFTRTRWDDDSEKGGRNIWYWFEPTFLAFLREADLQRIRRELPLSDSHNRNPASQLILSVLDGEYRPWLADSWRQFLWWVADCEHVLDSDPAAALAMIGIARAAWKQVGTLGIEFEEEANDGSWLRPWEIALHELARRPDNL